MSKNNNVTMATNTKNNAKHNANKKSINNHNKLNEITKHFFLLFVVTTIILIFIRFVEMRYRYTNTFLIMPKAMIYTGIVFFIITISLALLGNMKKMKLIWILLVLSFILGLYSLIMGTSKYSFLPFKRQYFLVLICYIIANFFVISFDIYKKYKQTNIGK